MRAWISPSLMVRSTASLATTPGKRLVIPSITTRGAPGRPSRSLSSAIGVPAGNLRRFVRNHDLAVDGLLFEIVQLSHDVLGEELRVAGGEVDPVLGETEDLRSSLHRAVDHRVDRIVEGDVDPL